MSAMEKHELYIWNLQSVVLCCCKLMHAVVTFKVHLNYLKTMKIKMRYLFLYTSQQEMKLKAWCNSANVLLPEAEPELAGKARQQCTWMQRNNRPLNVHVMCIGKKKRGLYRGRPCVLWPSENRTLSWSSNNAGNSIRLQGFWWKIRI